MITAFTAFTPLLDRLDLANRVAPPTRCTVIRPEFFGPSDVVFYAAFCGLFHSMSTSCGVR